VSQGTDAGRAFVSALGRQNFAGLEQLFTSNVKLRALVPTGVREREGSAAAAAQFRAWFGDATELDVLDSDVAEVADRLRIGYFVRTREDGAWYLVEQKAYCETTGGKIEAMNLLCSGFRPEEGP
jgi:hypothetical protein